MKIGFAVALLAAGVACHRPISHIDLYDGFESRRLSGNWSTDRFARGAVSMQSEFVRAGRSAAKIVLHSGDKFEAGLNGSRDTERAELLEARRYVSRENATYEYSFSELIPADFPIVPTRLVIAQWKQNCPGDNAPCSDFSPAVAVRYVLGVLSVTRQIGRHQQTIFETSEDLRGKWTDYRFQLRFTPHSNGLIRGWLNGRQVIDYTGPTAYPENAATGYPSPSWFYFKMGLYRDVMQQPMTIYIDEYRKKELPEGL